MMIMIAAAALAAAQPVAPAPDSMRSTPWARWTHAGRQARHEAQCCCDDMDKDHERACTTARAGTARP